MKRQFERGVFVAQWVTQKGEPVLIARTRHGRLACEPMTVERDVDPEVISERLWNLLDAEDPEPILVLVP